MLRLFLFSCLLYIIYRLFKIIKFRRDLFLNLKKTKKKIKVLPLNYGIGQILDFTDLSDKSYKKWSEESYKNDNNVILNYMLEPYLLTCDTNIVKECTITNRLPKASAVYDLMKPIAGSGLFLSDGELWKKQRTLINPMFSPKSVSNLLQIMEKHTIDKMEKWKNTISKTQSIDFLSEISTLTLHIITESAFGDVSEQNQTSLAWSRISENILNYIVLLSVFPQFIVDSLPIQTVKIIKESKASIIKTLKKIIKKKKEDILLTEEKFDLLSLLMTSDHEGEPIPEDLLIDEMFTFLIAGHETTSSSLSVIAYYLCSYPEIQEKLRDHINQEFKDKKSISFNDIEKMKYIKQVVNECARMMPVAPEVDKETNQDMFIDDFFLPKGTMIAINIYGLHHNPTIWENPEKFNPDRWEEENLKKIPQLRYNFIPFSVGSRNCVGKVFAETEVCLILSLLLHNFRLEFDDMKKDDVKFKFDVTMRPVNLKIKLIKVD
eukprot:gene618-8122_t